MTTLLEIRYVDWTRTDLQKLYIVAQPMGAGGVLSPVRLGRGRFAQVVMGTSSDKVVPGMHFLALKFLTRDDQSHSFSRNARSRYFAELVANMDLRKFAGDGIVFCHGAARLSAKISDYAPDADRGGDGQESSGAQERTFLNNHKAAAALIEEAARFNDVQARRLDPAFLAQIQGEFFVMDAAEGSLEDFLIDWRPWNTRKCFQVDTSLKTRLENELQGSNEQLLKFMKDLNSGTASQAINVTDRVRLGDKHRQLVLRYRRGVSRRDCSGMSILEHLASHSPSLRDCMVVSLWDKAAQAVSRVHSHLLDGGVPMAHRDLKFGNFLFSPFKKDGNLILTDLGFVAPNTKRGGTLDFNSAREVGMVALGSRLFRGPEQRDALPPPEVRFRVISERQVEFFNFGDNEIQVGDRLESPDRFFSDFRMNTTSIVGVEERRGRVRATLEDSICDWQARRGAEDYLGFILKLSGQHSDIFALGSFLYYLASGGHNPEGFYDACLRNVIDPDAQQSCVALALSLCVDGPEAIAADLHAYQDRRSPLTLHPELLPQAASRVRTAVLDRAPSGLLRGILQALRGQSEETETSRGIRFWRENPTVQRYMRDKNGIAIPFPLVYEVIRCMVRDKPDSYVSTHAPGESLCHVDCRSISAEIKERAEVLRTNAPSIKVNLSSYAANSPLQFFVLLRMAWPIADFESSAEESIDDPVDVAALADNARALVIGAEAVAEAAQSDEDDFELPRPVAKSPTESTAPTDAAARSADSAEAATIDGDREPTSRPKASTDE